MITAKRQGRQVTVYLDDGRPMPISSFEDTPPGFPFTARQEDIEARFPGQKFHYFDLPDTAKVGGLAISDAQVLRVLPEAKKDMGPHTPYKPGHGEVSPSVPVGHSPSGIIPSIAENATATALPEFRDMMRRYHYAKGKEKKELERDLVAVASFLIAVDNRVEPLLQQIKLEETSEKKRFTL